MRSRWQSRRYQRIPTPLVQPVVPQVLGIGIETSVCTLHSIVFLAFPDYPCERHICSSPHVPPLASLAILLPPPNAVPCPCGFFQFAAAHLRLLPTAMLPVRFGRGCTGCIQCMLLRAFVLFLLFCCLMAESEWGWWWREPVSFQCLFDAYIFTRDSL